MADPVDAHPAVARLEDQIAWYDRSAIVKRRAWRTLQSVELVAATSIPVSASLGASGGVLGVLGGVVVVAQGLLELLRSQTRYLAHRRTCEALLSERALYRSRAGPYREQPDPEILLAERVEEIRGAETAEWVQEERARMLRSNRPGN